MCDMLNLGTWANLSHRLVSAKILEDDEITPLSESGEVELLSHHQGNGGVLLRIVEDVLMV